MSIGAVFRPFYFRCIQFDFELVPNQTTKCLRTISLILVKFTPFRGRGRVQSRPIRESGDSPCNRLQTVRRWAQKRDLCRGDRKWAVARPENG